MELPNIRKISECFIKPKYVVEESKRPCYLGSFELLIMSMCYLQKGLLFDKLPSEEEHSIDSFLEKLKDSLSSTLTHFYPLAGQLVTEVDEDEHSSFIFIDSNKGPGAKFIHAVLVDTSVKDLISGAEVPAEIRLFFELGRISTNYDAHDDPMLVVQVTQLVDGIFIGISANHAVFDGTSLQHFLSSWSEIFRSNGDTTISRPPIIHKRWFPEGCGPIIRIPYTNPDEFITRYKMNIDENPLRKMIFHFSPVSMASLKARANGDCAMANEISSFQALSALVWRSIVCARRAKPDEDATCLISVNGRPRVNPPLSPYYFGNMLKSAFCSAKVGEILESSLGRTAMLLHKAIGKVNDAFLRNKFSEWAKSPQFLKPSSPNPGMILISGLTREDVYGIDFGLGKSVAIRTASNQFDGKVVAQPGKEGRGSVSLEISLSPTAMSALLQETELLSFLSSTS